MKVTFPLSLKISLWLLLNFALLAVVGVALLVAQGGFGLDSLVHGATGTRAQELGNSVVAQFVAAPPSAGSRQRVLDNAHTTYGAEFLLFHPSLPGASKATAVPVAIMRHVNERPRGDGPPSARLEGPPPDRDETPPGRKGPSNRKGPPRDPDFDPPPFPRDDPGARFGPGRGSAADDPQRAFDESRGRFLLRDGDPKVFWLGVRVVGDYRGPATLVMRVDSWWALMRLLDLQPWLLAAAGAGIVTILFWLPFVRGMTRALAQLTSATGAIAEGRFDTRVPDSRRDEIGALGGSVNRMAGQLDTLVNGQKRFLADIAHELGSPIGRLQVATEILESRAGPELRDHVADVREEVQQMGALVNELLAFTKAGLRARDAELAPVPLAPLVQRVLSREDGAGRVVAEVPADLTALADETLLDRALGNLVRNALRYAPEGAVTLTILDEGRHVRLTVGDDGPGVPPEALARLGEPFYRPEAARTREGGGAGLGLAIVRSGIEACRGTVAFRNRTPHGFEAEVRLGRP